jgi:hypothetical protein
LAGSMIVAVIAFVGDIHEFFEKDRPEGPSHRRLAHVQHLFQSLAQSKVDP